MYQCSFDIKRNCYSNSISTLSHALLLLYYVDESLLFRLLRTIRWIGDVNVNGRHHFNPPVHCDDVIMDVIASQITSLTIVYSIVYSGTDQRKHQRSASLAVVRGIHQGPVNSPHKGPVTRKMFPFDDVIMIGTIFHVGPQEKQRDLWHIYASIKLFCLTLELFCHDTYMRNKAKMGYQYIRSEVVILVNASLFLQKIHGIIKSYLKRNCGE